MDSIKAQEYKEKSKTYFEKISPRYSNTIGRYTGPMHDALIKELEGKNFSTLLDVGCGIGTFLSLVSNKFGIKVSAIDISPGMVENAESYLEPMLI